MSEEQGPEERTWTEELDVAANEVVDTVRELIHQGNVRRIIIRRANDEVSAMAFFTPILAAVGALAALLASVKVQGVRVEGGED